MLTIHIVAPGETIEQIAARYGVPLSVIQRNNGISAQTPIVVGQALLILRPQTLYNVVENDTVYSIAQRFGTTVNSLYRNNYSLSARASIFPGETIVISYEESRTYAFEIGGYAYPFISQGLLRTVLPYTNYLIPFTYGFEPDGTLVVIDDKRLIDTAVLFGVSPVMHISTLTSMGNFSNELASQLLANPVAQDMLINNILENMLQKGYKALDIDFEYVFASDKDAYSEFVGKLTRMLNSNGFNVTVALPPKISDDQPGLLYQGIDYAALGAAANSVLLMTYEWGYSYGPPLAVAPVPSVRRVLDYAVTRIPRDKIFMGMPNYGYDWTLPYMRGNPPAPSVSTITAMETAYRFNAVIEYDQQSEAPFFYYTDENGTAHVVWFEDTRSVAAKLSLVNEYNFKGVLYWDFMRENPQNYSTLNALVNIEKA